MEIMNWFKTLTFLIVLVVAYFISGCKNEMNHINNYKLNRSEKGRSDTMLPLIHA